MATDKRKKRKEKICDVLAKIFFIIGILSLVALWVTIIVEFCTDSEWYIIYKIYGIVLGIAVVGFSIVSFITPISSEFDDDKTIIPKDTNYTYTRPRKYSSKKTYDDDTSYSPTMIDKAIGFWAFDKAMNKMTGRDRGKDDWSLGNNTWDKKYPNAFDNDFGADYEDNSFNKFDDSDGY